MMNDDYPFSYARRISFEKNIIMYTLDFQAPIKLYNHEALPNQTKDFTLPKPVPPFFGMVERKSEFPKLA